MGPRASTKGVVAGQAACHESALVSNKMEVAYISDELAVVQVTFEDDKLGFLELLMQLRVLSG